MDFLYLEWAPSNILSPKTALETDIVNNVVGEKEIKRVLLEQAVEAPENDLDPDRVEVRRLLYIILVTFCLFSF